MKLIYILLLAFGLITVEAKIATTIIIKDYCFAEDYQIQSKYEYYLLACCMANLNKEYALLITEKEFNYVSRKFKMIANIKDNRISFLFKGDGEEIDCFLIDFETILEYCK